LITQLMVSKHLCPERSLWKVFHKHSKSIILTQLVRSLSGDEEVAMLRTHLKRVAKNISDLSSVIPRESFYALIRFIVDKASNSEDSSDFFDSLVEELSTHSNVRSVLEGI